MEYSKMPPGERKVVYTEQQGNVKYTYYDDGIVKITRYKRRHKIYWGRIFIALVVFVLLIMGIVQLIGAAYRAVTGKGKDNSDEKNAKSFVFDSEAPVVSSEEDESSASSADSSREEKKETEETNNKFSNASIKVCIDPGHGDYDVGSALSTGITESGQVLELGLLVKDCLEDAGAEVVMTRSKNDGVSIDKRCSIANDAICDFFVSLHRNSSTAMNDGKRGICAAVNSNAPPMDTALAKNILKSLSEVGVSEDLGVIYGYPDNPAYDYPINTNTVMPSCQVELGYITDDTDNQLFDDNEKAYAQAISDAIIQTAIDLEVIDEDGNRLIEDQLISSGKSNVTIGGIEGENGTV